MIHTWNQFICLLFNSSPTLTDTYHALNVETLSGHDVGNLLVGERLENSGLTSVIKTKHEDTSFLLALLQTAQQFKETHYDDTPAILIYKPRKHNKHLSIAFCEHPWGFGVLGFWG